MKKILGFFIASAALAPIIAPGSAIRAARVTERAASTGSGRGGNARVKRVMKPTAKQCSTEIEYCINYYCSGGDSIGGDKSYVDVCGGRPASAIKPGVESCLRSRTIIKSIDYSTCSTLIQAQVQAAIADWAQHDANVKYASAECKKQQEALGFAKKCHSALLASDGAQSNALRSKLESLCGRPAGGTDEMLGRFYNAGAYGYSDLQAQNDLMTTGQAGARRENWRQTADAVLVGYSEMAELACGFENYSITKVNQYQLDSRDNVAMAGAKAEAAALGQLKAERQVAEMYRKQDCLARALPANANHWEWIEGGDPACRVACAGGYVRQGSESCMAQHSKLDTSPMAVAAPFFGINLGQEPEHITSRDLRPEVKPAPAVPAEKDNPDPKPDDDKGGVNCATCSCSNAECKAKCAKCNRKGGDSCADCPQHAYGSDAYNNASDDYWIGKLKCRYEKQCCIFGGPFAPGDATTENKRLIRAGIDKKILTATWTYRLCESDGKTYAHTATQGGGGGNCKCSNDTSTDDKFVESLECRALDNTNCCIYNSTLNTDKIRNNGLIGTWRFCNGGGTFTWPENPDPAVGGDDYKDHICTRINGLINQNNFNDLRAFAYEKLPNNESMEPWITSKFPNAVSAYRTTYLTYANLGLVGGTIQVDAKCLADGLRQTAAEIGCSGIPIVDMIGIDCSEMQP
ncbi:MAG: hypothetical protein LBT92_03380, partial [Rickettsiales bacterium]|nr:hypothetical protein [Rickettsiales bacterium]